MKSEKIPMNLRPKVRYWVPGAAMEEEDLRRDIRDMAKRGFGGIEAVVLQSVPPDTLLSENGWGTPAWDRMVDVMNEETSALGMSLDLAAGPGWPIASPVLKDADDPGVLCELTYGILEVNGGSHYEGPLPERRTVHEEGTAHRIAVMAYQCDTQAADYEKVTKTAFGERTNHLPLIAASYVDLTSCVDHDRLRWDVPGSAADQWTIFAFWYQPAVQKINGGKTYVVDHLSRDGAKAVADYWEPILSSHAYDAMESLFCDSLEYNVAADWTPGLEKEFLERRGYDLLPYLPFIGMINTFPAGDVPGFSSSPACVREQVNNDYMEVLTQLYCSNHLAVLEKMAEKYGKSVRYQVAYNKPFEEERCGLFVGIPENEALGRAQLDGQRLMAAAAHLGRKKRYSFECAAEFGHCYGQGYEDLLWWVKRSQMAGMNAQVLHGASYSGHFNASSQNSVLAQMTVWPGYEGFGKFVSNNWNRTPDAEHARGCMDAIARMNGVFRGQAKVDLCIFRQAYENNGNGPDFYLYEDDGALMNRGYSYEYVSDFLLREPVSKVRGGQLDRDGVGYQALIVPAQERMSLSAMERILELTAEGLPVVLIGGAPKEPLYFSECNTPEKISRWEKTCGQLWGAENAEGGSRILRAASQADVPAVLEQAGVLPRIGLNGAGDVMTAVRYGAAADAVQSDRMQRWYILYGYNRIHTGAGFIGPGNADPADVKPVYQRPGRKSARFVDVTIRSGENEGKAVFAYDPWTGAKRELSFVLDAQGRLHGKLAVEEDEMLLLCVEKTEDAEAFANEIAERENLRSVGTVIFDHFAFHEFVPDSEGEISFLNSHFEHVPSFEMSLRGEADLLPWHEMDERLLLTAGEGIYSGTLTITEMPEEGEILVLQLGHVYDTFTVFVNGTQTAFPDQVMKKVDITGLVHPGENRIEVKVVSELFNRLCGGPQPEIPGIPSIPFVPRNYGLCPTEDKPTGVFAVR